MTKQLYDFENAVLKEINRRPLSILHVDPNVMAALLACEFVVKRHIDGSPAVHSTPAKKVMLRITDAGKAHLEALKNEAPR